MPGIIFVTYNDPFGGLGCDRTGPRGRQCREQLGWWKSLVLNVIFFYAYVVTYNIPHRWLTRLAPP